MSRSFPRSLALATTALATTALAATQLMFHAPVLPSDIPGPSDGAGFKAKLAQMGDGLLVTVYGDGAGPDVYDLKGDNLRPSRDIFSRWCDPRAADCDDVANWSSSINLSNTAALSSATIAWQGPLVGALPHAGDNDKPNVFDDGDVMMVSWTSKYCPGGVQGSVSYIDRDLRELPFNCLWAARSLDGGLSWLPAEQISDGSRDARQDTPRGSSAGWAVTWQEDPAGLQTGDAEGPGDGASGAKVTHGTDIWYTFLPIADVVAGAPFRAPVRLTDNFTHMERKQGTELNIESGTTGASRPNFALVGTTAVVAYEETKGSEGVDEGKFVRYHAFPYDRPPSSCAPDDAADTADTDGEPGCHLSPLGEPYPAVDDPARAGCILSDPAENARRVRFLTQGTAGPTTGIKLYIFWKQGMYDQGGPSDIVGRAGRIAPGAVGSMAGFNLADLDPAVALPGATQVGDVLDGCYVPGDRLLGDGALANLPGQNLSAETALGGNLAAGTDDNHVEDARAHRGIINGDFIALGHSYTPDWAVARYTDLANYEFWIRTSTTGARTWGAPRDLTSSTTARQTAGLGLPPTGINVKEPRIVKPPPSGPGCPTGSPTAPDTTDARDCRNGNVVVVAWGSETNVYEHLGGAVDLDLFVTRSTDKGATWESVQTLAGAAEYGQDEEEDAESQLQVTPQGKHLFAVWNQTEAGANDAMFISATEGVDVCPGFDDLVDLDHDGVPDGCDLCVGADSTGDADTDGVCDDLDVCLGDDATGDADADGSCDDGDLCLGADAAGDTDADGICDDLDLCVGADALGDSDGDGTCEDLDLCVGEDSAGDGDGDSICDDLDFGLAVSLAVVGAPMTLVVSNAPPGAPVGIFGTRGAIGSGPCAPNVAVCLSLRSPRLLVQGTADAAGSFTATLPTPNVAGTLSMQAVWLDAGVGDVTPPVRRQVQHP